MKTKSKLENKTKEKQIRNKYLLNMNTIIRY